MLNIKGIELPSYDYLRAGNEYKGSRGRYRYIIKPSDGGITAAYWCGPLCSDLSEMEESAEFALDSEGHSKMTEWIVGKYFEQKEKNG